MGIDFLEPELALLAEPKKGNDANEHDLSVRLRGISPGFAYAQAIDIGEKYRHVIPAIDEIHLEFPEFRPQGIRDMLEFEGIQAGCDMV